MNSRALERTLWPAVVLLAAVLALFEFLPIDLWLQDHLYNPQSGKWLIDAKQPVFRLLFYSGPKPLIMGFGGLIAIVCFGPEALRRRFLQTRLVRQKWLVVLATLISAPLLISGSKGITHVFCPFELSRYGGAQAYKPICELYTKEDRPAKWGRGFPAGHASGGFALLSLACIGATRRSRFLGVAVGFMMGTLMGTYQILKGAHFLSHTIVTALLCWIIFLIWHRVLVDR